MSASPSATTTPLPEDAGPRGGEADRAALVAADRHVGLARGQHHGAAAGGAAGIVRGVVRVAHRSVVAGMPGAGERERLAIGGADDRPARIENAGDDGRIEVGHEAVEQARSDCHRDAGDARDVLHGHALPPEHAAGRARDVAAPVPAIERVVLAPGPPAAVAGIFHRQLRLGKFLQLPVGLDRTRHQRTIAVGIGGGEIEPVIGGDPHQHRGAGEIGACRHRHSIGPVTDLAEVQPWPSPRA